MKRILSCRVAYSRLKEIVSFNLLQIKGKFTNEHFITQEVPVWYGVARFMIIGPYFLEKIRKWLFVTSDKFLRYKTLCS